MSWLKRYACLMLMLLVSLFMTARPVLALSAEQKKVLQSGIRYFNVDVDNKTCQIGSSSTDSAAAGPVYFLGDSIGTQVKDSLISQLGGQGWGVQANAKSSRNLSGGSAQPDGLAAIDLDQEYIKTTKAVVIELGTNTGGFNAATVNVAATKIHTLAPSAKLYWIDTAVVNRPAYAQSLSTVNSVIQTQAQTSNYQVISWNKKVFGDQADPTNISGAAQDTNGYIRHADEYVHLSDAGITAMTSLISTAVTGGGTTINACGCSTNLIGGVNAEKVYNYLVSQGLTPIQAAGLMGNMQAEAHFEPRLVQYGGRNSRGETSVAGQPSSLDDTMVIDGHTGYGIIQWTSQGRQQSLHNLAANNGTKDGDLGTQITEVWAELNGSYQGSTLTPLKSTNDLREATRIVLENFESPADQSSEVLDGRTHNALSILTQFGSNGGTPPPAGSSPSC